MKTLTDFEIYISVPLKYVLRFEPKNSLVFKKSTIYKFTGK